MRRRRRTRILAAAAALASVCVFALGVGTLRPAGAAAPRLARGTKLTPPDPRYDPAPIAERLRAVRPLLFTRDRHALARAIADAAHRQELEPRLVLAVIRVESGFDARAVSPVGALGLMQVMPETGRELAGRLGIAWHGPETLFDPVKNVEIGTAYLRQLADRYRSLHVALAAYNWGPGRIDRRLAGGEPVPGVYPRLVLSAYGALAGDVRS